MRFYLSFAVCLVFFFGLSFPLSGQTVDYPMYNRHNHLTLNVATGEVLQVQDDGSFWTVCPAVEPVITSATSSVATSSVATSSVATTSVGSAGTIDEVETVASVGTVASVETIDGTGTGTEVAAGMGRFSIYATHNLWTFLMMDSFTGRVWLLHTSAKDEEQIFSVPIIQYPLVYSWDIPADTVRFRFFPSHDIWTFILVDSFSGRVWQVRYSGTEVSDLSYAPLNVSLWARPAPGDRWLDRFQVFPVDNVWTFILLDTFSGRLWQLQYSAEDDDTVGYLPINEEWLAVSDMITDAAGKTVMVTGPADAQIVIDPSDVPMPGDPGFLDRVWEDFGQELVSGLGTDPTVRLDPRSIFSIFPSPNLFQYYLINRVSGEVWKFQWTIDVGPEGRWIEKLN